MKHNQKGFGALGILLVIVLVGVVVAAGLFAVRKGLLASSLGGKSSSSAESPTTAHSAPATPPKVAEIKGVKVSADSFSAVTIAGAGSSQGTQYYGKVQQINAAYVRLYPAYYYTSANTLVLLGAELHAPEPAMYINVSNIAAISQLATTDAHYQALQAAIKASPAPALTDAFPSLDPNRYIKAGQYQAAFFDDGKVLFGKLKTTSATPLFVNNNQVFTLRSSGQQVSLSVVDSSQVASSTAAHITFWENLQNTGHVSKAIDTYLKQNP